ncbi:VOC family protein [Nocardia brasiliensis]|uniref:VOC family protein n=1 Tax=Nocardia brasiliensis TaxID=37326 RepID=UPI00366B53B5
MPFAPCLGVKDTATSKAFYEQLGFVVDSQTATDDDDIHMVLFDGQFCGMLYRYAHLESWLPSLKEQPVGFTGMFYLEVRNFEEMLEKCTAATEIVKGPMTDHTGTRMFYIADPDGYVIGINDADSRADSDLVGQYNNQA